MMFMGQETRQTVTATDLLLLNASNYPALPIYPYSFVQVSALAARHGLTTARLDLLGTPRERWPDVLAGVLRRTRPRLIGVHLRQADSIFIWNYADSSLPGAPPVRRNSYWPVDDTVLLVEILRSLTDTPVMVGGFGFSTQAPALLDRIRPDLAVVGEPDEMFARFDDVLAGRELDRVANLVHRDGEHSEWIYNPRVFLPPPDHTEYDATLLRDIVDFYPKGGVTGPDAVHVPVEIQRGCPYRCYFCTEPFVKGKKHRTRDLDVVMADISFLAESDVSRIWMICSEMNIGSNDLLFEMARRMRELNKNRTKPVAWSAYLLPNPALDRAEIRSLLRSSFEPSWNQFTSYDDANLKETRVPYRSHHAVTSQLLWAQEEEDFRATQGKPARPLRLDMFLGNSYATAGTISTTLRKANEAGFADLFDESLITRATRVFDLGEGITGGSAENAYTYSPRGRLDTLDLVYPTFSYPPHLVAELGGNAQVDEFFAHVEDTYLSHAHRGKRDWPVFLSSVATPGTLTRWCAAARDRLAAHGAAGEAGRERLEPLTGPGGQALFERMADDPAGFDEKAAGLDVQELVELLIAGQEAEAGNALTAVHLPGWWDRRADATSYEVGSALAAHCATNEDVLRLVTAAGYGPAGIPHLAVRYCLYLNNIVLRPDWTRLVFAD